MRTRLAGRFRPQDTESRDRSVSERFTTNASARRGGMPARPSTDMQKPSSLRPIEACAPHPARPPRPVLPAWSQMPSDTKSPVVQARGTTPMRKLLHNKEHEAARMLQSVFRGRQGRRHVSLRRVAALMNGTNYADSDEEAEVEGAVAKHLRFALKRRSTHRPSLALKATSTEVLESGSSKTDVAATPEVTAERGSPGRGSPGAATPHLGGLRIVPLSAPPKRASTTETATRSVIDAAFLTWNVNGHSISREDARVWAQAAGPADAFFISIQELIDIEAKEGLPDRAVRRGAN